MQPIGKSGLEFPNGRRFTAHWLTRDPKITGEGGDGFTPLLCDASFTENSNNLPHEALLHYTYGCKAVSAWADRTFLKEWKEKSGQKKSGDQSIERRPSPMTMPGRSTPENHPKGAVSDKLAAGRVSRGEEPGEAAGAPDDDNTDLAYELVCRLWEQSPLQQERTKRLFDDIHAWQMSVAVLDQ